MSRRSITLKCGSVNNFFIARLRTTGSTPRAAKGLKSELSPNACASSSVGNAGTASSRVSLNFAGGAAEACAGGAAGSSGGGRDASSGSAGALPDRTSALRCDHRPRKPSATHASFVRDSALAFACAAAVPGALLFFGGDRGGIAKPVLQGFKAFRPFDPLRFGLVMHRDK